MALAAAAVFAAEQRLRDLKPGFNLFSVDQDIQMGREYAAQVERQMVVVNDPTVSGYVQRIGRRLASTPQGKGFPFSFKVVNEKSINAFALPGGPTFTHTGLIVSADNDAQIAGVLAHEMSHVILRHSTNQVSKAQMLQLPAMLAGSMAGGRGGITGSLAQLGIGLGAQSMLLKFSRNAERDADLLGARIMNEAGYNPIEMARFFEKLEAETGKGSRVSEFLSDHPNPGNRVKAVQDEIMLLPRREYTDDASDLQRVKAAVQGLPAVSRPSPGGLAPGTGGQPGGQQGQQTPSAPIDYSAARPSGRLREFQGGEVVFSYPDNWEVFTDQQTREVTVASKAGIVGQGVGYGIVANVLQGRSDLQGNTQNLVAQFQQRDPNLQVATSPRSVRINGYNAMVTRLRGRSPFGGAETDTLLTIDRPNGVFFMLFVVPEREVNSAQPVLDQIVNSIRVSR